MEFVFETQFYMEVGDPGVNHDVDVKVTVDYTPKSPGDMETPTYPEEVDICGVEAKGIEISALLSEAQMDALKKEAADWIKTPDV